MKKYELMMIFNPEMGEDNRNALIAEVKEELSVSSGAKVLSEDVWGVRDLAYKINGSKTGFYLLLTLGLEKGDFFAASKAFNLKKEIWRYMFVRLEN